MVHHKPEISITNGMALNYFECLKIIPKSVFYYSLTIVFSKASMIFIACVVHHPFDVLLERKNDPHFPA